MRPLLYSASRFVAMKFSTGAALTVTEPKSQELALTVTNVLKEWMMVLLTLAFVVLYGLALAGRLRPLPDQSVVIRLEPVLFIVIGYYFGRLPAQQTERTLKDEIKHLTKRADAAHQAREIALQSHEALDQKLKNAWRVLSNRSHFSEKGESTGINTNQHGSVVAALSILSSED